VLSSETLNPHNFWSTDINLKYSLLTQSIRDTKWFDPYAVLGAGHTYRDFPHGQHRFDTGFDNSVNANVGGGVNIWCFKNAGFYLQSIAKFDLFKSKWGGSNYVQFSAGVAFKIGSDVGAIAKVEEAVIVPSNYHKSKEAEEAAEYLRQILNK
jgi:hypothetical protein